MNWKINTQYSGKIFWLVLLCGTLLSLLGFKVATLLDSHNRQLEQQSITQMISDAVHTDLSVYISILNSVRGLFISSPHVSRQAFSSFASSELENHHSIQALEWIPHVKKSQLKTYQQQAIQDGLFDFNITELSADGRLISASQREEYFPVYYIEPLKGNEAALGFDLASSKQRQTTMQQARLSRQIQATASIILIQETAHQNGFLVFLPVFKHESNRKVQQQAPLLGYVLGVFRITDLFNVAVKSIDNKLRLLDIELVDHTDPAHPQQLMIRQNLTDSNTPRKPSLQTTRDINFAGRSWSISTYATNEFIAQHHSFTPWLVLITGFIFTLTITAYIRTLIINEARIRKIVNKRTSELQSSEQLNLKIVEHIIDALITIDARGRITRFNPAAVNMFGYTEQQAIGKNVKMLMPEPYHSEHDNYLLHHQQTGEKRIIGIGKEATAQHKDGRVFPVHLSVGETHLNGKPLYVGTITDLTELKNSELEMVQFTNRLNLATQAGSIGVWDYNLISFELEWDDRMYEIYGVKREDFSNPYKAFQQAVHPDDRQRAEAEFVEAMKGGIQFDTEFRIIWPKGEERHIHASAVSQFDTQGRAYRMTGINMDITERKLIEQSMLQAKQVAEEASRQKSAFLNVMSHELRTPLTVILGYLPLLKNLNNMPPPETIKQIADDMDISGQHLIEMINDLLDISKIEAGQLNLSPVETRSRPLIQEMITKFENMASQKNIKLVIDMEDFSFKVDTLRLRQILINLIGNALKFTQQGQIIISAWRDESFATFRIKDTGIGIPESALPFIFDAFNQVDNSSTRTAGGTGLGLAITQRLVDLHGGTIVAESRPESGTTFTFTIKQQKG